MSMHDKLRALDTWLQNEAARIEGMSLPMQAKADGYIAVREKIDAILAEYADIVPMPKEPTPDDEMLNERRALNRLWDMREEYLKTGLPNSTYVDERLHALNIAISAIEDRIEAAKAEEE